MSGFGGSITAAVVASACAGLLLLAYPDRAALVGHVLLVVVLALALGAALGRLRRELPQRTSAFAAAFERGHPTRARPASLARVEREVTLATGTAFDVHYRLRPLLLDLAGGLLLRRGVDLERSPDRARALLGPDVWALVRPDLEPPDDRTAAGVPIETIDRALDDLEALAWS